MPGNPKRLAQLEGNPWDRQRSETARSYERFCAYRDTAPRDRNLPKVATLFGVKPSAIEALSQRYRWVERAERWDSFKEEQRREAELEVIREMGRRQADQSKMFQAALVLPLRALTKKLTKNNQLSTKDFEDLSIGDLYDYVLSSARVYGSIANVERVARGEPSDIQNTSISGSVRFMAPVIVRPNSTPENLSEDEEQDEDSSKP